MKLLGLQSIEGGVALSMPSGRQVLVALPHNRERAACLLGARILNLLDDSDEPHAQRSVAPGAAANTDDDAESEDVLEALDASIEAGRLVWQTLQLIRRGRR